jgi:hypothetical protein
MRSIVALVIAAFALALAHPAAAQDEQALKAFFEGKRVVVRIDMPGTSDGVDVEADAQHPLDYRRYGDHLKTYGTAIRAGDGAVVTLVKSKGDHIEFHLGGGGYGTFGDDTSTSVYIPRVEKSSRERELEQRLDDEHDSRRRREIEHELDELRERRERENRRIDAERERAEEVKRERLAERRLQGGSRFNIKYQDDVPHGIRPEEVMAALAQYVDFGELEGGSRRTAPVASQEPLMVSTSPLRKGMLRSDVQRALGEPVETSDRREGGVTVTRVVFASGDQRITAEFVEDVLVRYTIASR